MTSLRHNTSPPGETGPASRGGSNEDELLDAARAAIMAVGWSRTTLTDIARRAGVSRMTLYRRWPDTRTMLADLITREWGRVVLEATAGDLSEDPERSGGSADSVPRLTASIIATVRALRANELLRRIVEVDPEVLLPYLLDRRGRSQDRLAASLASLIAAGQRIGDVRAGDPDLLARSVLLACHGFALSVHTMTDTDTDTDTTGTGTPDTPDTPDIPATVADLYDELAHLLDGFLRPRARVEGRP